MIDVMQSMENIRDMLTKIRVNRCNEAYGSPLHVHLDNSWTQSRQTVVQTQLK